MKGFYNFKSFKNYLINLTRALILYIIKRSNHIVFFTCKKEESMSQILTFVYAMILFISIFLVAAEVDWSKYFFHSFYVFFLLFIFHTQ